MLYKGKKDWPAASSGPGIASVQTQLLASENSQRDPLLAVSVVWYPHDGQPIRWGTNWQDNLKKLRATLPVFLECYSAASEELLETLLSSWPEEWQESFNRQLTEGNEP